MSTVYQQKKASKRGGQKQHPQRRLALPGGRWLRGDFDQSRVEEDLMAEDTATAKPVVAVEGRPSVRTRRRRYRCRGPTVGCSEQHQSIAITRRYRGQDV
jgi:hypothetical protein